MFNNRGQWTLYGTLWRWLCSPDLWLCRMGTGSSTGRSWGMSCSTWGRTWRRRSAIYIFILFCIINKKIFKGFDRIQNYKVVQQSLLKIKDSGFLIFYKKWLLYLMLFIVDDLIEKLQQSFDMFKNQIFMSFVFSQIWPKITTFFWDCRLSPIFFFCRRSSAWLMKLISTVMVRYEFKSRLFTLASYKLII